MIDSPPWTATTRLLVVSAILIGLIALVILAMSLVKALVIAALFALLFDPVVAWMCRRWHMNRKWAVRILFITCGLLAAGLPAGSGALLYTGFRRWTGDLQAALTAIQEWLSQPLLLFGFDFSPRLLLEQTGQILQGAMPLVPGGSLNILASLGENLLWFLVIIVCIYFFLQDGQRIKTWLIELTPPAYGNDAAIILNDIGTVWAVFVRAQVLVFVILLGLFLLGSWIVVILYQLGMIPFSTFGLVIMIGVVYALVSQVDNIWLKPVLYSHHLRLHPGLVFVALVSGLIIGGVLAAFVIVPLIATGKVLANYVRTKLFEHPTGLVREIFTDDVSHGDQGSEELNHELFDELKTIQEEH
jgi:predicted PurR-regulated permease PerM